MQETLLSINFISRFCHLAHLKEHAHNKMSVCTRESHVFGKREAEARKTVGFYINCAKTEHTQYLVH